MPTAAEMLAKAGRIEQVADFCRRAAETGNYYMLRMTAKILTDAGHTEEALFCYQRAADGDDDVAERSLSAAAEILTEAGRTEEALAWLIPRADGGNRAALTSAAEVLAKMGRTEEAAVYCQRAIEAGNRNAIANVAYALAHAGHRHEAEDLYRRITDRQTNGSPRRQQA